MKTTLKDRILWYTGHQTLTSDQIVDQMFNGTIKLEDKNVSCLETTPDIQKFNTENPILAIPHVSTIHIDDNFFSASRSWIQQNEMMTDDQLMEYIIQKLDDRTKDMTPSAVNKRVERVVVEMEMFKKIEKLQYLKQLVLIINAMKTSGHIINGRGSSAASYILYLIGVHRVDSVLYNIDPYEFFKIKT